MAQHAYQLDDRLDNNGKTLISEGLDANYYDMINYAVFCMILINEGKIE